MKRKLGAMLLPWVFQVIVNAQAFHSCRSKPRENFASDYRNSDLYMTADTFQWSTRGDERSKKRIVFIRHGRTYMNDFINGIHFGQPGFTDVFPDTKEYQEKYHDSPLGPRGVEQVKLLKDRLERLLRGDATAKEELL